MQATFDAIKEDIVKHPILLYMKGSKLMPQCGFSNRVIEILNTLGIDYETRDVLEDPNLRAAIKEYSDWPTLPQLYVRGEFVGGCDIVTELFQSGELKNMVS